MPTISEFYGIQVIINFGDHNPPHFHIRYGNHKAVITIETLSIEAGRLPPRALNLILEWATLHKLALRDNWAKAANRQPVQSITPLE